LYEFTFKLDESSKEPLYLQLYKFIKNEIESKNFIVGSKLPSVRNMATFLGLSRTTIEKAYHLLMVEGYVDSKPRSGLFITSIQEPLLSSLQKQRPSFKEKVLKETVNYDFRYGSLNFDKSFVSKWRKSSNESLDLFKNDILTYGDSKGEIRLRIQIAQYLKLSRGVSCQPDQIILGAGTQYLLSQICQMLLKEGDSIAMEEPGYDGARAVFQNHHLNIVPIQLDQDGINTKKLKKFNGNLVYLTPSHQFPYGMVLPIKKRLELLKWAAESNRLIIEDDYDGELRYHGKTIPSLQGLDQHGKVIYIGTFSKALLPSIRISYMVLPEHLLEVYQQKFELYDSSVSKIHQFTLFRLMRDGYWERHLRKIRTVYKRKHNELLSTIKMIMGDKVQILGKDAGLHIIIKVNGRSEEELIQSANSHGIKIYPTSKY
jgi:GntR family transcriptional regulator / MocR family aminotransferase